MKAWAALIGMVLILTLGALAPGWQVVGGHVDAVAGATPTAAWEDPAGSAVQMDWKPGFLCEHTRWNWRNGPIPWKLRTRHCPAA